MKPHVAAAQSYFAVQTRRQELNQQRDVDMQRLIARHEYTESDKRLSGALYEKEMSDRGIATIKNEGDKVMFGGKTTRQMKQQYGITTSKPLANRLPNVVLAAKSLSNEMTASNLESTRLETFTEIREEHTTNNKSIRSALIDRGIVPEEQPPAEDTEEIRKRVIAEDKRQALEEG
jgi:DNA-damage-inducible protein D